MLLMVPNDVCAVFLAARRMQSVLGFAPSMGEE